MAKVSLIFGQVLNEILGTILAMEGDMVVFFFAKGRSASVLSLSRRLILPFCDGSCKLEIGR